MKEDQPTEPSDGQGLPSETTGLAALLHPPNVQRFLLTSRAHFLGGYRSPDGSLAIDHASPEPFGVHTEGLRTPFAQSWFVVSVQTPEAERTLNPTILFRWGIAGEVLASLLSVLFGKSFAFLGMLVEYGSFRIPIETRLRPNPLHSLGPYNHEPRKCAGIDLNLVEVARIDPILERLYGGEDPWAPVLRVAVRFYQRALVQMDEHPELAFLDLVACGEVIADHLDLPEDVMRDEILELRLARIEEELPGGDEVARFIRGRLFQVRRKFARGIASLLDDAFFQNHEAAEPWSVSSPCRNLPRSRPGAALPRGLGRAAATRGRSSRAVDAPLRDLRDSFA